MILKKKAKKISKKTKIMTPFLSHYIIKQEQKKKNSKINLVCV